MAFSKRKSRRNPLQRLSDQRRSLALAGLAAGAVFSAAVLRRKRRGEEVEFEPTLRYEEPAAAVEVPPPASEPDLDAVPRPINAAPTPAVAPAPTLEPATGELSAEEASILAVLAQSGRSDDDRTAIAVATSLERDSGDVTDVLRKLGAEGVVSGKIYTASGDKIWAVTERGVRRLGAQS
ncbi:MAG TPA: hypothetical protein VGH14_09670 [Solirubrobacterales bacterium]